MSSNLLRLASALFAGTVVTLTVHAQTIDTTPTWNGVTSISSFGEPNTGTYGQTFRTPVGSAQLNDFTFWLIPNGGADGVDFAAYVMEWDVALNRATGSVLYQSAQQLLATPSAVFTSFTFSTGGLLLDSSKQYVAFLSASNFFDDINGTASMGAPTTNVYADGSFMFNNNGNNFGALTTTTWSSFAVADAAFVAHFGAGAGPSAVPEPSTYGMVGAGALLALVAVRRRRRATPAV